jgi:pyruvate kinase
MDMRRRRSAKIVATLGPSSSTSEKIAALFEAGVDVFRLNFSHGTQEEHRARFEAIRVVERDTGRPIGILADLQGPKLRLGTFAEGRIELATGEHFRVDLDRRAGDTNRAPLPHPEIFEAVRPGTELLLDDGKVRLSPKRTELTLRLRSTTEPIGSHSHSFSAPMMSPRPANWSAAAPPSWSNWKSRRRSSG